VLSVKSTSQNDPVLRFVKGAVADRLGGHLRQVLLFGSRARGDATAESDYDLLVVVDQVDSDVIQGIDAIAGQALLEHGAVVSAFPIAEDERVRRKYSPLLINVAREGVAI
jgi:predicted nucleotidyltransferase